MQTTDTLLLAVDADYSVKIGPPPSHRLDNYKDRLDFGYIKNITRIFCSPDGELFCIRQGDLYKGAMPSNKDVDWFSVAQRVGRYDWGLFKIIFFHPNGELYATTYGGEFYKGPKPDDESVPWMYKAAKKIGNRFWDQFDAMFFDAEGILHAVKNDDKFYKGSPPTDETFPWISSSKRIGNRNWQRLTHFMGFTPDKKLWCVDKHNGNIYRGNPPSTEHTPYVEIADYLGWNYQTYRFLSFIKDKTIRNILSFEFLVDEAKKVSEAAEVIEETIYDNKSGSSILRDKFSFEKNIKQPSSFTHKHGFTFQMGKEHTVKTGIPFIAEGTETVSMNTSSPHNWSLTKANETEVSFSSSAVLKVWMGKASKLVASVMKAEITVPYKARAQTMFGSEVDITGTWNGVAHYNLMVKQKDYVK